MSGAGRSTAAKSLEDIGWYVVDNLPPGAAADDDRPGGPGVAARRRRDRRRAQPAFSTDLKTAISGAGRRGRRRRRWCSSRRPTRTLVRRFENVRRPHPMQGSGHDHRRASLPSASCCASVRGDSDIVLDTSSLNVHELRVRMHGYFGGDSAAALPAEHHVVRLQVRAAGGRGPGRRLPVPAEPALGAVAAAADRAGRPGARLRARPAGGGGVPRRVPEGARSVAAGVRARRQEVS